MIKFNKDYVDTMVYPCTLKQLLESVCEKAGVELGTQTFANDTFSVTDNQFEGKALREILQNIAKCAFSWARIGQDNKLYLDFENKKPILPEEYQQVEYIENTGSSYIDTGKILTQNNSFEFKMKSPEVLGNETSMNCGSRSGASSNNISSNFQGNNLTVDFNNSNYTGYRASYSMQPSTIYKVYSSKLIRKISDENDNVLASNTNVCNDTIRTPNTCTIFKINPAPQTYWLYARTKLYYFKIWENDELIMNLIPCYRKSDNVIGLYDLITKTFFINQGTGTFLKGKDVNYYDEVITINEYMQDSYKKANEYYGPINRVTYAETNIKGQEESVPEENSEDIIQNGLKELVIYDNLFAYTTEKRHALIQAGERLLGLTYMPIQDLKCVGLIYLDCNDIIKVEDEEENAITSRVLSHIIRYNGAINDNIQTEAYSVNEQIYKNNKSPAIANTRTEIIVDRAQKEIFSIAQEIGDRSQKTTTITQDIDGIASSVQDIEDLTNKVDGIKSVSITDAYPNENILELHIYGNNSVFDYLYPADDLYPDDSLLPYGDSKIRFYNSKEDRTIDLGIMEVLRQNEEVRDEVAIDYQGNVTLIRRVNANGTTKPMPEVTQLGQLHFTLVEGTNTFEIVNYTAPIEVKYAQKNSLTEIFATKLEMSSSITQTADAINTEVRKKVNENEVISKINQSAEQIQIEANKISLARQRNKFDWR